MIVILGLAVWTFVVLCAIALCVEAGRADGRADAQSPVERAPVAPRLRVVA